MPLTTFIIYPPREQSLFQSPAMTGRLYIYRPRVEYTIAAVRATEAKCNTMGCLINAIFVNLRVFHEEELMANACLHCQHHSTSAHINLVTQNSLGQNSMLNIRQKCLLFPC